MASDFLKVRLFFLWRWENPRKNLIHRPSQVRSVTVDRWLWHVVFWINTWTHNGQMLWSSKLCIASVHQSVLTAIFAQHGYDVLPETSLPSKFNDKVTASEKFVQANWLLNSCVMFGPSLPYHAQYCVALTELNTLLFPNSVLKQKKKPLMEREKRVLDELRNLYCDPHPYFTIFPSESDFGKWESCPRTTGYWIRLVSRLCGWRVKGWASGKKVYEFRWL